MNGLLVHEQALRVFVEAENYPILIHCIHGKDRTGARQTNLPCIRQKVCYRVFQGFQAACSQLGTTACPAGSASREQAPRGQAAGTPSSRFNMHAHSQTLQENLGLQASL